VLDWILARARVSPPARVVDVACGTGIATRMWAARGFDVIGVEPNEAMLREAQAAGGARFRQGEAAALGLPDRSADLVSATQAFHYFDVAPTLAEWRRVLVPGGCCAAFWYRVVASPVKDALHELFRRFGGPAGAYPTKKSRIRAVLSRRPEVSGLDGATFPHQQVLDLGSWRGRVLASSRMTGAADRRGFEEAVEVAFERHAEGGRIVIPLETTCLIWRLRGSSARGEGECLRSTSRWD